MAAKDGQSADLVRSVVAHHTELWRSRRPELERYRNVYGSRFHANTKITADGEITVETGDGPSHVDSHMGVLFSRAPAVEVGEDLGGEDSEPRIPQIVCNTFLGKHRAVFEQATRLALLYPAGFLRVGPKARPRARRPADSIEVIAVPPWEVILDFTACDWDHQRWIGHRYTLPLHLARMRFPRRKFEPRPDPSFFSEDNRKQRGRDPNGMKVPEDLQICTIVEFYDRVREELIFWSADVDGGEGVLERAPIPLHEPGTREPTVPILPLCFAYDPDAPLNGISPLARIYDQLREKNLLRTNQANCIRRDARLYEADPETYQPDQLQKLLTGRDGDVLLLNPGKVPGRGIAPIQVATMSNNFEIHSRNVEADLTKGSILASFTRGEPAGGRTSAMEIGVLAEYTTNNVGRMARERDAAIEGVARAFLASLTLFGDKVVRHVQIEDQRIPVTGNDLDREWVITALDQGGTPMSRAIEQQRFMQTAELAVTLGVPSHLLVDEMVRLELLPAEFRGSVQPPPPPEAAAPPAPAQGAQPTLTDEELLALAASGPPPV